MTVTDQIVRAVRGATAQVFSTMLGHCVDEGEVSFEGPSSEPNDGVVSFIGIAGAWIGTGTLICSPRLACCICNGMLMTETTAVDEEVLDAVAELTNIIVGCAKTDLEATLGPLALSIPTVIFGRNFKTKTAANTSWIVLRFHWQGEPLIVRFCLAPSEQRPAHSPAAGTSSVCAVEIGTKG
jgi:chemotaxis protein CheX